MQSDILMYLSYCNSYSRQAVFYMFHIYLYYIRNYECTPVTVTVTLYEYTHYLPPRFPHSSRVLTGSPPLPIAPFSTTEMRMVRWAMGVEEAKVEQIETVMRRRRLEWFGHVKRKDETENIRAVIEMKMEGKRPI